MKLLLLSLVSVHMLFSSAIALDYGFCRPDPTSKKYLEVDFQAAYPKEISFECDYECGTKTKEVMIKGKSKVRVSSLADEAQKIVCQGVIVKKARWGYEFERIESFYSHQTDIAEIKQWARNSIQRDHPYEQKLLGDLKKSLLSVARAYKSASQGDFLYFGKAAKVLFDIAQELPEQSGMLDRLVFQIKNKELKENSANKLVIAVLKAQAKWRF